MKRMKFLLNQFYKLHLNGIFIKKSNTSIITLLITLFGLLLFSSCVNDVYFQKLYVVDNEVNKEFLIYFESSENGSKNDLSIKVTNKILPNELNHILYNDIRLIPNILIASNYFNIWIYDPIDSVYLKLNADDFDPIDGEITVKRIESKTDLEKYIYSTNINKSLVEKMTKDTHLTDSIFGLNASQ